MKNTKLVFWIATAIIFLWEGLMPLFFINSDMAKQGISHLGYPEYFRLALLAFKVSGALALMLPMVSPRVKEWAYAGFTFNFIFAFISHMAVDGMGANAVMPLAFIGILAVSYFQWKKLPGSQHA